MTSQISVGLQNIKLDLRELFAPFVQPLLSCIGPERQIHTQTPSGRKSDRNKMDIVLFVVTVWRLFSCPFCLLIGRVSIKPIYDWLGRGLQVLWFSIRSFQRTPQTEIWRNPRDWNSGACVCNGTTLQILQILRLGMPASQFRCLCFMASCRWSSVALLWRLHGGP